MMNIKDLIRFLDKWMDDAKAAQEEQTEKKDFNNAFESVGKQTAYLNVKIFIESNNN